MGAIGAVKEVSLEQHREALENALRALENVPLKSAGSYGRAIALDPNRIDEAKALISQFLDELSVLLEAGERTEVYQIGVQLFPLTRKEP